MVTRAEIEEELLRRRFPAYGEEVRRVVEQAKSLSQQELCLDAIVAISEIHRPELRQLTKSNPRFNWSASDLKTYKSGHLNERIVAELKHYFEAAWNFDNSLRTASDEEIREILRRDYAEKRKLAEQQARDRDAFAWFNLPDCDLDLTFWQKSDGVSAEAAAAIALKKDPRKLKAERLRPYFKVSRSIFTEEFARLLQSAEAYVDRHGKNNLLTWPLLLQWLDREGLALDLPANDTQDLVENDLETRKSHSYQQIILSLLMHHCGFDYNLDRKEQIKRWSDEILKLLKAAELPLKARTVQTHLGEVYDYYRSTEIKNRPSSATHGGRVQ